jgi:uncharacterized protein (UPF0335 family)
MTTESTVNTNRQESRIQIDNSILASLIALSQTIGQLQGEIAVLKVSGIDLEPIYKELQSLTRIMVTGDSNVESIISQIRGLKEKVTTIQEKIKKIEDEIKDIVNEDKKTNKEVKLVTIQNVWKIVGAIATMIAAGVLTWLGIKV